MIGLHTQETAPGALPDEAIVDESVGAKTIGKSKSWMQKARVRGDGPPFLRLSRSVRYRVGDLREWPLQSASAALPNGRWLEPWPQMQARQALGLPRYPLQRMPCSIAQRRSNFKL